MNTKLFFMDSYKVDKFTCIREDCQTMYCNNREALQKMVSIAKAQDRKGIVTGEAYFNENGIICKKAGKPVN